ncbi:MAG: VWA domain-containing protein [Acidobacteria bacterium]|nr:VWA domain-containing protein [Acidobacteriota bacterium]MBV9184101.1 VWA domain-containing protein [Acidobacteriota bacterium]
MKSLYAASVVLCASALTAQVNESIEVRVVNVDVTVTSKGAPVRGLTAADFEIFEDGKRQAISNFYTSDETRTVAATTVPAVAGAPAEVPKPDERFRKRVLVLVDNNHTTRHARDGALLQLEAMINDRFHGDYEWSIGVIGRGVALVLPLSSNKAAIHEALEIIRNQGTRSEGASTFAGATGREGAMLPQTTTKPTTWSIFDRDFNNRLVQAGTSDDAERAIASRYTTPAIIDAARGFASTPGRKIVFLLTGDPGLNDIEKVVQSGDRFIVRGVSMGKADKSNEVWAAQKIIEDARRAIIHEANASDVSFYIWNVQGLSPAGDVGVYAQPVTNTSAVFWLSNQTGGQLVTGNDPAQAVKTFDTVSSNFYSLGYKPTHPDDGKYHAISVRVIGKGNYTLAYRSGYSDNSTATQLERAMTSPTAAAMQTGAMPVSLGLGTPATANDLVTVPIEIKVPFRALQFLPSKSGVAANVVVYVSVFNEVGKNLVATRFPLTPGFKSGSPDANGMLVYRNAIQIRKGERHRVVVAVRDAITDSVGMATEEVKF